MGGRGSGSGFGGGTSKAEQISSTMGKYQIDGNVVTFSSGNKATINSFTELKDKRALDLAKKNNINDPVLSGRAIIPRNVAERAIQQGKQEKANYKANMEKNVKGYDELTKAIQTNNAEYEKFKRSIERGGRVYTPNKINISELGKKYPRASSYIKAESFYYSPNPMKSTFGKEAMQDIRFGKSHIKAIAKMEEKWKKYVESKAAD